MVFEKLKSSKDRSVNFILPLSKGYIETRYVRRHDDYFIAYLSSHNGCKHACRMCHLTATGQTYFDPVSADDYIEQALQIISHYDKVIFEEGKANLVHYNWMARGEPLSNPYFIKNAYDIVERLQLISEDCGLDSKFKISTIIPNDFKGDFSIFSGLPLEFYYSIYTMNEKFRKRWLPNSKPIIESLNILKKWQENENRDIVLHWAFIDGENDSEDDVNGICDAIEDIGLKVRVNIVRYNPPNKKSKESTEKIIDRNMQIMQKRLLFKSKILPRVGEDCFASCGMFVN